MTENEMKKSIIDNIYLLSEYDYVYFFGNPVSDIGNLQKTRQFRKKSFSDFTKVELKIRASIYIENWGWNTDKVYQHLIRKYPFV